MKINTEFPTDSVFIRFNIPQFNHCVVLGPLTESESFTVRQFLLDNCGIKIRK